MAVLAESARHIFSVLRRRWMIFAAVFIFVVAGVTIFTLRQTPLYTATANLVVNSRVLNVADKSNEVVPGPGSSDEAVPTEIEIMRSDAVAKRTATVLYAKRLPGFAQSIEGKSPSEAKDAITRSIKSHLDVTRSGTSNVVNVQFESPDPETARETADEIARQYLATKFSTRKNAADVAGGGLGSEIARLGEEVEQAEAQVSRYKQDNNLLSTQGVTLTEQELSTYKQQEASARATLAEEQARLNTARAQLASGSSGDDVGEALGSGVISGLRAQRAQQSARLAQLLSRYKSDYPEVVQAQSQLDDIDREIRTEILRVMSNLQARVQVASDRAGAASSIVAGATTTLKRNGASGVQLNELERKAAALNSNYTAMLGRQSAIATQTLITDEDARIFSPATLPLSPSHPNKPMNIIVGIILGFVLACIVVWLLQIFDRGIINSVEVESRLGLQHLANIPSVASIARRDERQLSPQEFVTRRPMSMMTEALRSLRLLVSEGSPTVVGITSSRPNEGKSTLAISLARIAVMSGVRTLLIDGDIRKPSVANMLGLKPEFGLTDVLSQDATFEQALIIDDATGLAVLPTLVRRYTPDTILSGPAMANLLADARKVFGLIIIDTAPALATVDARILLQQADHVVMAVQWNRTLIPVIQSALKKMSALNIEPDGVVLTQVNMKALATYGRGDIDYNYRDYASYYQN